MRAIACLGRWRWQDAYLFVVLSDQASIVTEPNVAGAPAIVVEILSPGTRRRDFGIKRHASTTADSPKAVPQGGGP